MKTADELWNDFEDFYVISPKKKKEVIERLSAELGLDPKKFPDCRSASNAILAAIRLRHFSEKGITVGSKVYSTLEQKVCAVRKFDSAGFARLEGLCGAFDPQNLSPVS